MAVAVFCLPARGHVFLNTETADLIHLWNSVELDLNMSDQQVHHFLADGTQLSAMDDYDPKRSSNASRGSIGRASGVTNYTPDKLQIMLESVAEVIPTTDEEWDLVSQKFNKVFQVRFLMTFLLASTFTFSLFRKSAMSNHSSASSMSSSMVVRRPHPMI